MYLFWKLLRGVVFAAVLTLVVPVLGGLALTTVASHAIAAEISSIEVRGNQRVDASTIETYLTIKPGVQFGAADIDESVKVLHGTGLFADVDIRRSGRVLIITVAENPVVNAVFFEGNKKIKTDILEQVVRLESRGVLTDARLQADVVAIEIYYAQNGRSGVQVDASVTELGNNRVDVTFVIIEGDKTGIASITFIGNEAFSRTRLRSVIQLQKTNIMSWLNKRDIFSEEKLAADREALRRHYLKSGYADFQVLAVDVNFDAEKGKYHIVFTIDEGPKYRFGDITVDSSIPGVDTAALEDVIQTKSGRVFDSTKVERSVDALTIELARRGFVFAQVRPRGDRNYVDNIIHLTYVIDEGPRAYVERIEIRGNTKTRDFVIRREFRLSEGDAFNRALIDRAERRLRALDFFELVRVTVRPGSAPDKVIVFVLVKDKSTGSVSFAAGVSSTSGLIAEIALEDRNFLGRGQAAKISVGGGTDDRTYNVSFTEPYFLGRPILVGADIFRTTSGSSSARPFDLERTGGGVRLGLPLTDDSRITFNYKIASETTSDSTAIAFFPNGTRLISSVGYTFKHSTVDNPGNPHEGFKFKLSQDVAGVGGDARYMRTVADAAYYRPILPDRDVIGIMRIAAGNVLGLGEDVAFADNFFKGGETVRGFATRGYGPRDATGVPVGGKNFVVGTAEMQFPIPLIPPDLGLRAAVFADAGLLFGVDANPGTVIDDTAVRASVGGSILWASPFGLMRADFAHVLAKESYDETQLFRLVAGARF